MTREGKVSDIWSDTFFDDDPLDGDSMKTEQQHIEHHYSRRLQAAMVGEGLAVGCVAGGSIALYRMILHTAETSLRQLLDVIGRGGIGLHLAWMLALVVIAVIIARLMQLVPDTRGSGIPQIDAEVMGRLDESWLRVMLAKVAEGALCTFAGLSLGREGPSVQIGGMAGKGVSRLLRKESGEEHLLVTCGAAAGMSAAFHAPLTGVLFALEEIHREFNAPLVISAMASAAAGDFVTSQLLGVEPVLHFALQGDLPHADYLLVLLMGVICGIVGSLHNVGMFALQDRFFGRLRKRFGDAVLLIAFLAAGIAAFAAPQLLCGGDAILSYLEEEGTLSVTALIFLLLGKYLLTGLCFGSGAPGGTLLPLVIMGSLLGALCGLGAVGAADVPLGYLNNFIVLGVAGMFAASVRAPVTAVVLCFELTGTLDTLLAATAVSLTAYVTANMLKCEPFYEHLLANMLESLPEPEDERSAEVTGQKVLHTHVVGVGSLAEGKCIQDIPWPHNLLVVTIDRAGQRVIPRGTTRLQALDELVVIMDCDLEADTELLMHGICRGMTTQEGNQSE